MANRRLLIISREASILALYPIERYQTDIAARLHVSRRTVQMAIHSLRIKLTTTDTQRMTRIAWELGPEVAAGLAQLQRELPVVVQLPPEQLASCPAWLYQRLEA